MNVEEFSLNLGSKEIYNSEEPLEQLLRKTIFEFSPRFEVELLLSDEVSLRNICKLWLIHIPEVTTPVFINEDKLSMIPPATKEPENHGEKSEDAVGHGNSSTFL